MVEIGAQLPLGLDIIKILGGNVANDHVVAVEQRFIGALREHLGDGNATLTAKIVKHGLGLHQMVLKRHDQMTVDGTHAQHDLAAIGGIYKIGGVEHTTAEQAVIGDGGVQRGVDDAAQLGVGQFLV